MLLDTKNGDGHFELRDCDTQSWYRNDVKIVIDGSKRGDERQAIGGEVSGSGEATIPKPTRTNEPISVNRCAMYRLTPVGE